MRWTYKSPGIFCTFPQGAPNAPCMFTPLSTLTVFAVSAVKAIATTACVAVRNVIEYTSSVVLARITTARVGCIKHNRNSHRYPILVKKTPSETYTDKQRLSRLEFRTAEWQRQRKVVHTVQQQHVSYKFIWLVGHVTDYICWMYDIGCCLVVGLWLWLGLDLVSFLWTRICAIWSCNCQKPLLKEYTV